MPLSPSICVSESPTKIIKNTIFYFYNLTAGEWQEAKPAAVYYDSASCRVVAKFNATSTPKASDFTGLPVASYTPAPVPVVAVNVYSLAEALAAATAAKLAYAAAAAILVAIAATYLLAARRE
jgi:hypothetical protein